MTVVVNNVKIKTNDLEKLKLITTAESNEDVVAQALSNYIEMFEKEKGDPIDTTCTRDQLLEGIVIE